MENLVDRFEVGHLYTHEEVYRSLNVGNAGGIRPFIAEDGSVRRIVVMTSSPDARILRENPYHDRIETDVLVYTAAGLEGNQSVAGANRRLIQQADNPFPVYGFSNIGSRRDRSIGKKRWEFLGLLEYVRHYKEFQVDSRQNAREVWLFEMLIHREISTIIIAHEMTSCSEVLTNSVARSGGEGDRILAGKQPDDTVGDMPDRAIEIETVRRRMLALAPRAFEHLIRDVLQATGFRNVTVTRYSQDGGIDVNAYVDTRIWPIRGLHVEIQGKRWLHTVGRREVAELRGSLAPLARGAIVTTSFFSRAALTESSATGKSPIVLIDGNEFAGIVHSCGIELA